MAVRYGMTVCGRCIIITLYGRLFEEKKKYTQIFRRNAVRWRKKQHDVLTLTPLPRPPYPKPEHAAPNVQASVRGLSNGKITAAGIINYIMLRVPKEYEFHP